MSELKLSKFPETREIPLGCFADSVESVRYEEDGEEIEYRKALIRCIDEGSGSVLRDAAGQFWPVNATDVVIEFTPRAAVEAVEEPPFDVADEPEELTEE